MKEIVCPECGKVLEAGVATCPNCGCPIAKEISTVPCLYCGNMIAENATCPKCGGHFETTPKCGTLRIKIRQVKSAGKKATAPLYVNGQLVEVVSLAKGCDISIPITHPNISITFKTLATLEHTYHLDTQKDYILEIVDRSNSGFILYDNAYNEISKDVMTLPWRAFCVILALFALPFAFIYRNSHPVRSQYMKAVCLIWIYAAIVIGSVVVVVNVYESADLLDRLYNSYLWYR